MTNKISFFNIKGGVGKTTTVYNMAACLVKFHKKKVLLVDIDPQGNASASLGIKIWNLEKQIKDVFFKKCSFEEIIIKTDSGIHVAPSNVILAEEEIPISGLPGRELLLRNALAPVINDYDYILIDCPPNVGVFSINALMASKNVIVPVDMSYLGMLGIESIDRALEMVRYYLNHPINVLGIVATRFDKRNNLSKEVLNILKVQFEGKIFSTMIPETVKLREAPGFNQSIFEYDEKGVGAKAYKELTKEVIQWQNQN